MLLFVGLLPNIFPVGYVFPNIFWFEGYAAAYEAPAILPYELNIEP